MSLHSKVGIETYRKRSEADVSEHLMKGETKMSVIVSTKNSEKTIMECLDSLQRQTFKNFELIVVDAKSTDNTLKIIANYEVKLIHQPKGNLSVARNIGLAVAEGDPVVFLDSDCIAPDDWLAKIADRFEGKDISVLGGPDVLPQISNAWQLAFAFVDARIGPMISNWGTAGRIHGCNVAYRKTALKQVGGFNEDLDTGEEIDVQRRISESGGELIFDDGLTVIHYKRENLWKYIKQQFWYGVGMGETLRRYPRFTRPQNIGAIVFLALPALFLLVDTSVLALISWLAVLGAGCFAAYLMSGGTRIRLFPFVAPALLSWLFSLSIGQVLGLLGHSKKK